MKIYLQRSKSLIKVGYYVVNILNTDRKTYKIRSDSGFYQLLVGKLAVGMTRRMKHTCTNISNMCHNSYEFEIIHKAGGIFTSAFHSKRKYAT